MAVFKYLNGCYLDKGLSFSTDKDGDLGMLGHIYCPILGRYQALEKCRLKFNPKYILQQY